MVRNRKDEASGFGARHVQTLLLFFGLTVAYALRVNLSVAIVAMVDGHAANEDFEEFDWDEKTKSVILSSFFWGYVVTQIPAGQLAQRCGPKILLLLSIGICSMLAVLTPFCAHVGDAKAVVGLRIVQGLSQGFIFPSTHTMLSRWAPASERGRLGTLSYAGAQFGTVIMLAVSGVLASSTMGWPSIFYISGAVGMLWSVAWFFYGSNSPAEYRGIAPEEREFIESSFGPQDHSRRIVTPWMAILTSAPMIALTIAHSCHNWGFWTLLTEMPTYMKEVLEKDIKKNALLSSLPYFVMWILSFVFSPLSDFLINRQYLSRVASRKLFNTIGLWVPMVALLGLAFVPKGGSDLAIVLLTLAVGINSATYLGFQVNHIDLSPNHAGTMMGITNCAANIMSIIAPLIVGQVISDAVSDGGGRVRLSGFLSLISLNIICRLIRYSGAECFTLPPVCISSAILRSSSLARLTFSPGMNQNHQFLVPSPTLMKLNLRGTQTTRLAATRTIAIKSNAEGFF
ncbi:putative inorganic phosphate cotransporter isoform X3 [Anopheles stephensi]|uniref:putative inorganic phosphate cotransporter isoform X3 n=1 Tax=Anopheles stephensi TaxID=30069 RepID=UPI0016588200|nr:putative inorganic phosphate cotransporter isoform X3 [Anopheles stephensi]